MVLIAFAGLGVVIYRGMETRRKADAALVQSAAQTAITTVAVVHPTADAYSAYRQQWVQAMLAAVCS